MLDLKTTGLELFKNTYIINRTRQYRQPMIGTVNGSNRRFTAQYAPWDSDSTVAVYNAGTVYSSADYTVDYTAGAITFTTAPSIGASLTIDYVYIEKDDTELLETLKEGFRYLRDGLGVDWVLNDNDTNIYVEDDDGNDPEIDSDSVFSTDPESLDAFVACCKYAYLYKMAHFAAMHGRSIRAGDIAINNSKQATDIRELLDTAKAEMNEALAVLDLNTDQYGAYIESPKSKVYEGWFDWRENEEKSVDGIEWIS